MKTKKLKSLLQLKQKIISREEGYPSLNSGRDGDFQVRRLSGQGIFLFYKWNNKWYQTRLSLYTPRTAAHKDKIKIPIGVSPSSPGELSIDKTGHLKLFRGSGVNKQIIQINDLGEADSYNIKLSRSDTTSPSAGDTDDLLLWNKTGNSSVTLKTSSNTTDSYINYVYQLTGETPGWHGWSVGMDTSDTRAFKWVTFPSDASNSTTPSSGAPHGTVRMELAATGNLTVEGTLSGTRTNASDSDYVTVWDSTTLKYRTKANFISDLSLQAAITAGTNCTFSGTTLNVDDAFIKNDADDRMTGGLIIDKNVSSTDAGEYIALQVDFDKDGASTTSNTLYALHVDADNTTATAGINVLYGINNTPTLTHASDAGSTIVYGLKQVVTGSTNGISTGYGINQTITGSDTNIGIFQNVDNGGADLKFRSSTNGSDYFTLATSANGETTITTVDDDAALAHLNVEADGHVEFDGCAVGFDREATTFAANTVNTGHSGDATDIDFRLGNKHVLELTNNLDGTSAGGTEYLSLIFPATSGNFILALIQDGTGSRAVHNTAWKAFAYDASACDNTLGANGTDGVVRWAGGTAPTLTTTADKTDIISIYWDADTQTALATISYAF